ncbi:7685_t:CDS:1, partial [Scutellospora calospora]
TNSTSQIVHMTTILFNYAEISPVPYYSKYNLPIHNPRGVDAFILKTVCQKQFMFNLAYSYNFEKSSWSWISDLSNKTDLIEMLTIHSYDIDIAKKYHRKFNKTKLIDCIELDLKNTKNYVEAAKTFL